MRGEGGRGVSDDFGYVTIILPDPPQGSVIYSFSLKHTSANIFLVFTIYVLQKNSFLLLGKLRVNYLCLFQIDM